MIKRRLQPGLRIDTSSGQVTNTSPRSPTSVDTALSKISRRLSRGSPTYTQEEKDRFRSRIDRFTNIVLSKSTSAIQVTNHEFSIAEKLLLLSLSDQGFFKSIKNIDLLLLWSVVAELIIMERIETFELKKKIPFAAQRYGLDIVSTEPTGNDLYDDVLNKLTILYKENNSRRIESYITDIRNHFSKTIISTVAQPLINSGVLRTNRGVDLMVVNLEVYPIVDKTAKERIRKEICHVLTTIEDRYHIASMSPSTPIDGLSPHMYALAALLYLHGDMMHKEVVAKTFTSNSSAVSQLKHTTSEMIVQYEQWSLQRGFRRDSTSFKKLYHLSCEYEQLKKR
jgi:hypothetical protein